MSSSSTSSLASTPDSAAHVTVSDDAYVWAIVFDDTERSPEFQFTESAARHRFNEASINWNAHLFIKVASNSRDDPHAGKNFPVPVSHPAPVFAGSTPARHPPIRGYESDLAVMREPVTHTLKTDPQTFDDVVAQCKTFEIRKNDRDFRIGDMLHLLRTDSTGAEIAAGAPLKYSGQGCLVRVTHILDGYGLQPGWVILSIGHVAALQSPPQPSPSKPREQMNAKWPSFAPADIEPSTDKVSERAARGTALLWQCRPPKGKAWGPGTTQSIARQLHSEGFKVRALGEFEGDPFADFKKD